MTRKEKKKWLGILSVVFSIICIFSTPFQDFASLPDEIRLFEGSIEQLKMSLPVNGSVSASNPNVVSINGNSTDRTDIDFRSPVTINSTEKGQTELELKWEISP